MTGILNKEQESELLLRGFTRRNFFHLAVMVAGLALSVVGAMVALVEFRKPHLIAPL